MTAEIKVWGIVQGVGFRPFISRLASFHGLKGWVRNEGGCVHLKVCGAEGAVERFIRDIREKKPGPAEIVDLQAKMFPALEEEFDSFRIMESSDLKEDNIFIPPDLGICDHCREELFDPSDPRYLHPLISCMACGPRYSIMDRIPYDRPNTAMEEFPMCPYCQDQYDRLDNRRHHAQTISCPACGPQVKFYTYQGGELSFPVPDNKAIDQAIRHLQQGKIIAVKGIGGYHFVCTPFDRETVLDLRALKGRETKPFAVMFEKMADVKAYCQVSPEEEKVLTSRERPIVLLERKKGGEISPPVFGTSQYLGAFLPYTPVQYLLLKRTGPLIMTSANISDRPIIKEEEEFRGMQDGRLSGILSHNRQIRVRVEDSVVKPFGEEVQFMRRARGYAPLPIQLGAAFSKPDLPQVLAVGGQLKNTFCLTKGSFAYLSQYLGDMEDQDVFQIYRESLRHLEKILKIQPERISCDLHPDYLTTKYAKGLGGEWITVQHHYAHIASVMAERQIFDPVIGLSFDGTGYGTDGKMWGGEYLICSPREFFRAGHVKYITLLGGDSSVKEAWKTACCYLSAAGLASAIDDARWPLIKAALSRNINTIQSSSMGRLFDGVSSLLGISHQADYEGQCAIELERAAFDFQRQGCPKEEKAYPFHLAEEEGQQIIDYFPCIREMMAEKAAGKDVGEISYRFHRTVIASAGTMCELLRDRYKLNKVALSGGVFQNALLFQGLVASLREWGFQVYYNTLVPPNDGGLSLGQAFVALNQ